MLKVDIYTLKGTKTGSLALPKDFEEKENLVLLAQAIRVYEDRSHPGLAKAKTRAEVNLTTKKLYSQKGTGGARHGSKRAPIFVGGGVAHGPTGVKRQLSMNVRMKKKSLLVSLSVKAKNKEVIIIDGFSKIAKTKDAQELTAKLSKALDRKINRFTFVLSEGALGVRKSIRNLESAIVLGFRDLNPYNVFHGGVLLLDKEIFVKAKKKETKKK